ncbi:hypothetical protein Vadar_003720 [Vaccinium darrowii]|uniref:Uncharacterized protein n=1 Tax=Vaccinium darrowii TaxID=229202 RepID=A0ACB7YUP3_9ERIC|nr:hypothetical protein Vadar_003720 [Vaccinium darrowii]
MTFINEMAFFQANFMLQTPHEDEHQPPSLSPILPPCTSQDFHGVAAFLGKRSMSFSGIDICDQEINTNGDNDNLSDDGSQLLLAGERKRRLNMEQVKTLEKNFELANRLEPEKKMQLARALGLQPRQIAIWFQNRRARWKTKQLEKDYQLLKRQFDGIKADNDSLKSQNQKLQDEIVALKNREPNESINLNRETEGCSSNRSENSSDIVRLDISRTTTIDSPLSSAHPTSSRPLFPPSMRPTSSTGVAQLFQNSSSRLDLPCQKNITDQTVKEESSFCNMFCGIDDQNGFWPWLEQQQYN